MSLREFRAARGITLRMLIVRKVKDIVLQKEGTLGARLMVYTEYANQIRRAIEAGEEDLIPDIKDYYKATGLREDVMDEIEEAVRKLLAKRT